MEVSQDDKTKKLRGHAGSVDVEYKGRTYYGRFVIERRIITVSYEGRQNSAQVGNSSADLLAKIMLLELVRGKPLESVHISRQQESPPS